MDTRLIMKLFSTILVIFAILPLAIADDGRDHEPGRHKRKRRKKHKSPNGLKHKHKDMENTENIYEENDPKRRKRTNLPKDKGRGQSAHIYDTDYRTVGTETADGITDADTYTDDEGVNAKKRKGRGKRGRFAEKEHKEKITLQEKLRKRQARLQRNDSRGAKKHHRAEMNVFDGNSTFVKSEGNTLSQNTDLTLNSHRSEILKKNKNKRGKQSWKKVENQQTDRTAIDATRDDTFGGTVYSNLKPKKSSAVRKSRKISKRRKKEARKKQALGFNVLGKHRSEDTTNIENEGLGGGGIVDATATEENTVTLNKEQLGTQTLDNVASAIIERGVDTGAATVLSDIVERAERRKRRHKNKEDKIKEDLLAPIDGNSITLSDVKSLPVQICAKGGSNGLNGLYVFNTASKIPHVQYIQVQGTKSHVLQNIGNHLWVIFDKNTMPPIAVAWSRKNTKFPIGKDLLFENAPGLQFSTDLSACPIDEDADDADNMETEELVSSAGMNIISSQWCSHSCLFIHQLCEQRGGDVYACMFNLFRRLQDGNKPLQENYCENYDWQRPPNSPEQIMDVANKKRVMSSGTTNDNGENKILRYHCKRSKATIILHSMESMPQSNRGLPAASAEVNKQDQSVVDKGSTIDQVQPRDNPTIDEYIQNGDFLLFDDFDVNLQYDPQSDFFMIAKGSNAKIIGGNIKALGSIVSGRVVINSGALNINTAGTKMISYIPPSGLLGQLYIQSYHILLSGGMEFSGNNVYFYTETVTLDCLRHGD